jgi:hypothetical protein
MRVGSAPPLLISSTGKPHFGAGAKGAVDLTTRNGRDLPDLKALIAGDGLAIAKAVARCAPDYAPILASEKLWCIGANYEKTATKRQADLVKLIASYSVRPRAKQRGPSYRSSGPSMPRSSQNREGAFESR